MPAIFSFLDQSICVVFKPPLAFERKKINSVLLCFFFLKFVMLKGKSLQAWFYSVHLYSRRICQSLKRELWDLHNLNGAF